MTISRCADLLVREGGVPRELVQNAIQVAHTYASEGMDPVEAGRAAATQALHDAFAYRKEVEGEIKAKGGLAPRRAQVSPESS